ncbi:hypothetical protein QBC46DRAFT_355646 [Diplogelasinospora grovesii]|uniref:Uncharacterized protein n=1 Tax=Diplogelasinospora grovesii TaxID=303347 RepID=A0AAN6N5P1_9PEZI|nr:hypothetical protein QBC46DRAFT_355646 [Diplogelasinospora grovesii]
MEQDIALSYDELDACVANIASTSGKAVAHLDKLQSFSLHVRPNSPGFDLDISRRAIAAIIEALPESCANLEVDTGDHDHATSLFQANHEGSPAHLCDTLPNLLSRMRHLRLHLPDAASFHPISLPKMRTLLVNCTLFQSHASPMVTAASGEIRVTTAERARLARDMAAGLAVEELPPEESGIWRAANPKKMCMLWSNDAPPAPEPEMEPEPVRDLTSEAEPLPEVV